MNRGPRILPCLALAAMALALPGCHMLLPEVSRQPIVHNPFPQLSRVAVAPFVNLSDEPTVDGREFAMAYFGELQTVRGFEVVPVGVVEEALIRNQINLWHPEHGPQEARRLAKLLGVDAVVIGAVTDYDPYYPPRCGMRVEWYAANPGFHEIPAGYGLPWGTPREEYIPDSLVFEAEMALAKAQLATQSPDCTEGATAQHDLPEFIEQRAPGGAPEAFEPSGAAAPLSEGAGAGDSSASPEGADVADPASHQEAQAADATTARAETIAPGDAHGAVGMFPPSWPDARGFVPPGPSPVRPPCVPHEGPVMTHTQVYHGHDPDFTAALASYVSFRDDARFGGWQSYLERDEDFIRFCAHLHIAEMLTARGGGGESRVVRRWSESR